MNEEREQGFLFYATFLDTAKELMQTNNELALKYLLAVANYGIYGEYDEKDPMINALMQQVIFGIDHAQSRREKQTTDGSKGGRKRKFPPEKILAMKQEGKTNQEIANELKCSVRTVERAIAATKPT